MDHPEGACFKVGVGDVAIYPGRGALGTRFGLMRNPRPLKDDQLGQGLDAP